MALEQIKIRYCEKPRGALVGDVAAFSTIQKELGRCWRTHTRVDEATVDLLNRHMGRVQNTHPYSQYEQRASCIHVHISQGMIVRLNTAKGKLEDPKMRETNFIYMEEAEDAEADSSGQELVKDYVMHEDYSQDKAKLRAETTELQDLNNTLTEDGQAYRDSGRCRVTFGVMSNEKLFFPQQIPKFRGQIGTGQRDARVH